MTVAAVASSTIGSSAQSGTSWKNGSWVSGLASTRARLEIRHTSESHSGQIYLPQINTLLMLGVVVLVVPRQRERPGDDRLTGDDGRGGGEQHHRQQRPVRNELEDTSESHSGQIYLPQINTLLMLGVVVLVVVFRSSSSGTSARWR
jgi:hypothetical protein